MSRKSLPPGDEKPGRLPLNFHINRDTAVHKTLRGTQAMEAGVADHVWSLAEIAALPV
jgi:hypothetical protein